jgi:hypothetical protein
VAIDNQLCATHAGCLEGILEFLKSIGKLQNTVIAESAANGPTLDGFENYHYTGLAKKYSVKLIDLDGQEVERVHVFDETDFRPHPVRMSKLLLDRNNFVISAAKMKTHDRIVATLSLKNIILGAPVKDPGFRWATGRSPVLRTTSRSSTGTASAPSTTTCSTCHGGCIRISPSLTGTMAWRATARWVAHWLSTTSAWSVPTGWRLTGWRWS